MTNEKQPELPVVAYLRANRNGVPQWDEGCVCEDAIYPAHEDDVDTDGALVLSMPLVRQVDANAALARQHARIVELEALNNSDWSAPLQHPALMKINERNAASIIQDAAVELSKGYAVNFHDVAGQVLASSRAEIAELEAQLESIGAGGVSLLKQPAQCLHQIAEPAQGVPAKEARPAFYTAFGPENWALWQYAAPSPVAVLEAVMAVARNQGYKGCAVDRMQELGWRVGAVYAAPPAQAEDAARLDWLETDAGKCVFHLGMSWYTRANYGQPYRKQESLRGAIDAAIAAQAVKGVQK